MSQNLLEKCFEILGEMIMRSHDVSSTSSKTKNINKVGLDMPSIWEKARQQQLLITLGQEIYPCLRAKISQKVFRKYLSFKMIKARKITVLQKTKISQVEITVPQMTNSSLKEKILMISSFSQGKKHGYYQTSTESIYLRIIIIKKN